MLPRPNSTARTGEPDASRPAIAAWPPTSTRSPAVFPAAPAREKIQRSSSADPGATTAPAPTSFASSRSTVVRDAHWEVATGMSAFRNCVEATLVEGRTRTQETVASGSNWSISWAVWVPVAADQVAGASTRTPSDCPPLPIPWTQPEAVSTETPSLKWQIQSYACALAASTSSRTSA